MKKRLNMRPCTSKKPHTIGTCGGKEESNHTLGSPSKTIFLKDSRAFRSKNFSQNSLGYSKKAA
jgi:hypothetical protein